MTSQLEDRFPCNSLEASVLVIDEKFGRTGLPLGLIAIILQPKLIADSDYRFIIKIAICMHVKSLAGFAVSASASVVCSQGF